MDQPLERPPTEENVVLEKVLSQIDKNEHFRIKIDAGGCRVWLNLTKCPR